MTALKLIKHFESLELEAYKCPAGVPTIGYGSTNKCYAFEGNKITELVAEGLLMEDISEAQYKVISKLKRSATGSQIDAMISQAFNLSTNSVNKLIGYFNKDINLYKNKLLLYSKGANGTFYNGLLIRRICERLLFEGKEWEHVATELQHRSRLETTKMKLFQLFPDFPYKII